jgi:hypothetical protein
VCALVGIVSRGRLRCLGTPERLKARFGNGYMLAVVAAQGRVLEAETYVAQVVPRAQFLESFADTVRYRVAKVRQWQPMLLRGRATKGCAYMCVRVCVCVSMWGGGGACVGARAGASVCNRRTWW